MDKSPTTYNRRRSGRALSELPWDASDVNVDPESAVSLLASEDEGIGDVTPGKENVAPEKRSRKRWSDQPLPRKRTRSSTALGTDFNLKDGASKLVGKIFGKKGQDEGKVIETSQKGQGKGKVIEISPTPRKQAKNLERTTPRKQAKDIEGTTPRKHASKLSPGVRTTPLKQAKDVEKTTPRKHASKLSPGVRTTPRKQAKDVEKTTPRKHASKLSPGGGQKVLLRSPVEFVKEKQAMFAEIDAFELESEEEGPEEIKGKEKKAEMESPESSKGETAGQSNTKPEQSMQEVVSTEDVEEKENG